MRVVIQRVSEAKVVSEGETLGAINQGLLVLAGFEAEDSQEDMDWMLRKLTQLRIFSDEDGNMNLSLNDIDGELLLVSQFTLHASTKKGNRPSFIKAAKPDLAEDLYEQFKQSLKLKMGNKLKCGKFGADMKVSLVNDGPVTISMDTKNKE